MAVSSVSSVQNTEDTKLEIALRKNKKKTEPNSRKAAASLTKNNIGEFSCSLFFAFVIDRDHNLLFFPEFTCSIDVLCPNIADGKLHWT